MQKKFISSSRITKVVTKYNDLQLEDYNLNLSSIFKMLDKARTLQKNTINPYFGRNIKYLYEEDVATVNDLAIQKSLEKGVNLKAFTKTSVTLDVFRLSNSVKNTIRDIRFAKRAHFDSLYYEHTFYVDKEKTNSKAFVTVTSKNSILTTEELKNINKELMYSLKDYRKSTQTKKRYKVAIESRSRQEHYGFVYKDKAKGGVMIEAGCILKAIYTKQISVCFTPKKPKEEEKELYVGIELEFFVPAGISKEDIAVAFAKNNVHKNCYIKYDTSINNIPEEYDQQGKEVAILAPKDKIGSVIRRVCESILFLGGKVNKTCGLHVHFDMRQVNWDQMSVFAERLIFAQDLLYAVNPASRKSSRYCFKPQNLEDANTHYSGINTSAYRSHNTLEVRIHSGTLNPNKIINWIKLNLIIMNSRINLKTKAKSVEGWLKLLDITLENNPELYNYAMSRSKRFQNAELDNDESTAETPTKLKDLDALSPEQLALSHG